MSRSDLNFIKIKKKAKKEETISPDTPNSYHYTYPNSITLKNKYGITDFSAFNSKCSHETSKMIVNLCQETPPDKFDTEYIKHLHHSLFKDIFEWAGHTREVPFTLSDGTVAIMPEMKKRGAKTAFAIGNKIPEGLQKFEKKLSEKNNLQNISRKDFANSAAELFVFLNHIHPFREGNGRVQRMFFTKLAEAAGHTLDFSLITKERMAVASINAEEDNNLEPMKSIFEDISNPEKRLVLREFMDHMKNIGRRDIPYRIVSAANEGETYTGIYKGSGLEGFLLEDKGAYIVGKRDHLTPEQLKTLKPGDSLTFTVPMSQDLEKVLIPEERLKPLTKSEISDMVSEDTCVQLSKNQLQKLSKTVYGSSKALNKQMAGIEKNPSLSEPLADQISRSARSVSKLAGIDFIIFKSEARRNAEDNVELLSVAVENYAQAVKQAKKEILQEHQTEQKRREQTVEMPSKNLQNALSLPKEKQKEALSHPPLRQELHNFFRKLHDRLSPEEHAAIKKNDYQKLSESLGTSVDKAKNIIDIVCKTKEAHQHSLTLKIHHSKAMALTA